MKKMALVLTTLLILWLIWPIHIFNSFERTIAETRNLLSVFEIENVKIVRMLDFVLGIKDQSAETYIECVAGKILMEEEQVLISQSQKLIFEIEEITKQTNDSKKEEALSAKEKEKIKKEIGLKMDEISQKIDKISAIHLKMIDFLNEKFEFILKESEKKKSTPI